MFGYDMPTYGCEVIKELKTEARQQEGHAPHVAQICELRGIRQFIQPLDGQIVLEIDVVIAE